MGFLDTVRGALKGAVSTKDSKSGPAPVEPVEAVEAVEPVEPVEPEARDDFDTYTVKTGDTLGSICARHDVSYQDIARINQIENPDLIFPGQVFQIPKKK